MKRGNFDTLEDVLREQENLKKDLHNSGCGITLRRIEKLNAQFKTTEDELITISHLVESHAPVVRQKVARQYHLLLEKDDISIEERRTLTMLKEIIETKCPTEISDEDRVKKLCSQMAEMPKEWTIVQITSAVSDREIQNVDTDKFDTNPLYLSVFNCGQSKITPFVIKIPEPRDNVEGNKLELLDDLNELIKMNRNTLLSMQGKNCASRKMKVNYCSSRQEVEISFRNLGRDIQNMWLKEWRCLFIGKSQDSNIDDIIRTEIEEFFSTECPSADPSQKCKELLFYLTKGTQYITLNELRSGVKECCKTLKEKDRRKIPKFTKNLGDKLNLKSQLKHPVILVIDEALDSLPWETLDLLQNEPVSRVPSFHCAYFLYKTYEKEIEGGYKLVSYNNTGTYVVNPDGDLQTMECRMRIFFNYWLPKWSGVYGKKPTDAEFFELLTKADIFSYNGHGNGGHILSVERLQKTFVKAVVILFGCASTRIQRLGPQADFFGSYHMYLTARCPCVIGMLWEVTDLYCDNIKTQFLSRWIPSEAPHHWHYVNKYEWIRGLENVTFKTDNLGSSTNLNSPELQRALCSAKQLCDSYLNKAACVVRGLPVKLVKKH